MYFLLGELPPSILSYLLNSFRLDISRSSAHTRRRIWQEAITALFLTSPECKIPNTQPMHYIRAKCSEFPPYLLNFQGSPGERHAENIKVRTCGLNVSISALDCLSKILREVGIVSYSEAVTTSHARLWHLAEQIQRHFVGPDSYWKSPSEHPPPGSTRFFGNAWWIPFPPTLVRFEMGIDRTVSSFLCLRFFATTTVLSSP